MSNITQSIHSFYAFLNCPHSSSNGPKCSEEKCKQCTLIRGAMVIHPGLTYELFHYTMVHFDHILSGVQISTIADFSSMHSGDFCPLLQISSFA